jgi:hypothetical protein
MSYFIEGLEVAALAGLVFCLVDYIILTVEDAIDFHYSKKRGEI